MSNISVQNGQAIRSLTLPFWGVKAVTVQLLLLVSASFLLPALAHASGLPVRTLLPMHWPVLLVGLCYGWRSGLLVGLAAPALSFAISGLPPFYMLPAMTIELAAYGFLAGFFREHVRFGWLLSTGLALVGGRLVFLGFVFALGAVSTPFAEYLKAAMLPGLLGATAQLILLPLIAGWWVRSEKADRE